MSRAGAPVKWLRGAAGVLAACALAVIALSCGAKERREALAGLSAPAPHQRAEAALLLGKVARSGDVEIWAALERAARDPSPLLRTAAAEALVKAPQEESDEGSILTVDETLGGLLLDSQSPVWKAAARALGTRCGERGVAVLLARFDRVDEARAAVGEALGHCGVLPAQLFARAETEQRAHALSLLKSASAAQRASALRTLGALGRDVDVKSIRSSLDSRDGVIAAAAAESLGDAQAIAFAPRIAQLLTEPGLLAAAAARALQKLGPAAVHANAAALSAVATREDDESVDAARALSSLSVPERCPLAAAARNQQAAALLAPGCPPGPLAAALSSALALAPGVRDRRALPLLRALLQTGTVAGREGSTTAPDAAAAALAATLSTLLADSSPEVELLAVRCAEQIHAVAAGPALVALVRREATALRKESTDAAGPKPEAAASVADPAPSQPPADTAAYAKLMSLLAARDAKAGAQAGAQLRLADLLRDGAAPNQGAELLASALHAALALGAAGSPAEATALAGDPDPQIAAAAAAAPSTTAAAPAPAAASIESVRAALWSRDGAVRAAACRELARVGDAQSAPLRVALAQDAERRVRDACAEPNETIKPAPR